MSEGVTKLLCFMLHHETPFSELQCSLTTAYFIQAPVLDEV